MSDQVREEQIDTDLMKTFSLLISAFLLGWGAVILRNVMFAFGGYRVGGTISMGLGMMFSSFLWTLAWLAAGFLFGFLFGVPKVVAQASAAAAVLPVAGVVDNTLAPRLKVNTNLEEISDWLTKVLVGATLTQIIRMPHAINKAASFMALGDFNPGAIGFNAAILIYYGALGFLSGYIMTRMFFARAFALAD